MGLTESIAQALATFEGYFKSGTVADRNNNPGNLRAGVGQIGTDANGYAIFASPDDGWNALYNQINLDISRDLSLQQFIYKYAPPSDNNPTSNYLNFVASRTGLPTDVPLSDLAGASPPADASAMDPSPGPKSSPT